MMPRLYVHLVTADGRDLVIDRRGREVSADADLAPVARRVAGSMLGPSLDVGRQWLAAVYNEDGEQLAVHPLAPALPARRHAIQRELAYRTFVLSLT